MILKLGLAVLTAAGEGGELGGSFPVGEHRCCCRRRHGDAGFGMHWRDSCVLVLPRSFTTWCSDLTCCSRGISSFGIAEEHCWLFTIITTVSAAFFSTFSYLFEIVHLSFPTTDLFAGAVRAFLLEQIVQTMVVPFLLHPFLSNPCTANFEWPTRVNTSWSPLTKQW